MAAEVILTLRLYNDKNEFKIEKYIMKIGIIGLSGYVRRAYLPFIRENDEIELAAIHDFMDRETMNQIVCESGMKTIPEIYQTIEAFFAKTQLDAVIVSTPHCFHFDHVKQAIEHGCHVLVDKPLACKYHEAVQLIELASKCGVKISVGNNRRFEKPYMFIKEAINSNRIGKLLLANYLFANSPWYDYSTSWRGNAKLNAGGVIMDIGHLAIDTLVYALNAKPIWVEAIDTGETNNGVEQSVVIAVGFEGDILVSLTITYCTPIPSVQEELSIYGRNAALFLHRVNYTRSSQPPHITLQTSNGRIENIDFVDKPDCSKPLRSFVDSITWGNSCISNATSSLPTVQIIDAAYVSTQTKSRVVLNDVL